MEYHSFQWYSISEMHIIIGTYNIFFGFRLQRGAFYWSIGTIGTIDTNGISFIPKVFHWWYAYHYGHLEYFLWLQAARGCILLVHWYDWYQRNIIHSNGIPLVKCLSLWTLRIFSLASGCEGVHSTGLLVRLVRLVPMEYHSFQWYSIGEMHIIIGT